MKLYICGSCRYIFPSPLQISDCPDCGKKAVRTATEKEAEDYKVMQAVLKEEIRLGLYAAG